MSSVYFGTELVASGTIENSNLTLDDVYGELKIGLNLNDNSYYHTVMIYDLDAPYPYNNYNSPYLHLLIINIPGDDLNRGTILYSFEYPNPPKDSEAHRYVFEVYRQKVLVSENLGSKSRINFPVEQTVAEYMNEMLFRRFFYVGPSKVPQLTDVPLLSRVNDVTRPSIRRVSRIEPRFSTRRVSGEGPRISPVSPTISSVSPRVSPAVPQVSSISPRRSPRRSPRGFSGNPHTLSPILPPKMPHNPPPVSHNPPPPVDVALPSPQKTPGEYIVGPTEDKSKWFLPEAQEEFTPEQLAWERCTMRVEEKRGRYPKIRNPYAICSASVGTSCRGCGEYLIFENLPDDMIKAYASLHKINLSAPYNRTQTIRMLKQLKGQE